MNRTAAFLLGITLALGFALSAYLAGNAFVKSRSENLIRVKGYAETRVKSDRASWRGEITVRNPDLQAAYSLIKEAKGIVDKYIQERNIKNPKISWLAVNVQTEHAIGEKGQKLNKIENYVLRQSVEVSGDDIEGIDTLSQTVTKVIESGIQMNSRRPTFTYTGLEKLKIGLLAEATKNALQRAIVLAENSNGRVGSIASASQGVFQITPPDSTEITDYGSNDTSSIEKAVKAVVTVEFNISK